MNALTTKPYLMTDNTSSLRSTTPDSGESADRQTQKDYWNKNKSARRSPDHPVVSAAFSPLARLVETSVRQPQQASVLDLGSGNGFLSSLLEKKMGKVVCVDYSLEMLKRNPGRNKVLGSGTRLPFADKSFDVVVASHLLHHLVEGDRIETLSEMMRVAKEAVVSFEPNRNNPLMFLFSLAVKEERMALKFSKRYMRALFGCLRLNNVSVHIEGWIPPNKAPRWWVPIAALLNDSLLKGFGFCICSIGRLD